MVRSVLAETNNNIPATEKAINAYTSVCTPAEVRAAVAPGEPGVSAAEATIAPPEESNRRSATSSTARKANSRMAPSMNNVGLSMATAPAARICRRPRSSTTATNAAANPPAANSGWRVRRAFAGAKASMRTAASATPNTMMIGLSAPYWIDGTSIVPRVLWVRTS